MKAAVLELMHGRSGARVPFGILPAGARGHVTTPVLVPGTRTIAPEPAGATGHVTTPVLIPGSLTLAPAPAGATGHVTTPVLVPGTRTIAPEPAGATGHVPDPVFFGGLQQFAPAPAGATGYVTTPVLVPGTRTLAPAPAGATGAVTTPVLIPGIRVLAPSPAGAWGGALDPELVSTTGAVLAPAPAGATGGVPTPALLGSAQTLAPAPAGATGNVTTPVLVPGTRTLAPAPAGATGNVTTPVLENVSSSELAVEITAPSPTAALYSGVTQEISGTYTGSPTEIKAYWDDEYTELAGTSTDIGSGTWSLDVVPVYAQVGFTTLYVRAYDGDGYAYDTLAITVTQRGPMDLFAAERSYHAADDEDCTLSGGTPDKFTVIPDAKIGTSDSLLSQTSDANRWLVRSSDSNFAGRRTAYNATWANDVHMYPGSTSQVFGQRESGKVTTIVLGCCESSSGSSVGLLQTGTGGSYGAGRYADGTLVFADGGSPRTTSHTLRVNVPFALRVEWDDANNLANWYIYYDDGETANGSVTWSTAADYTGMYIGATDYGWYGSFCDILAIDGALGAGEWDAFVAQWLRGRMGWT